MADAESSRILRKQNCVLTEATRELAISAVRVPNCSPCPLPIESQSQDPHYPFCVLDISINVNNLAISPDSSTVWVCDISNSNVLAINTAGSIIVTIPISQLTTGIAVSPDGQFVYVTQAIPYFVRINTTTYSLQSFNVTGQFLGSFILNSIVANNEYVWGTSIFNILRYSFALEFAQGESINPERPQFIAANSNNPNIWFTTVTPYQSNKLLYIDLAIGIPSSIGLTSSPTGIVLTSDGATVWLCYSDSFVSRINTSTLVKIDIPIQTTGPAVSIALSPDNAFVWITSGNTITQVNTVSNVAITWIVATAPFTLGLAVSSDNSTIWAGAGNSIRKLTILSPPQVILVEGLPISNGSTALLLLTIIHGRAVDLTSYVQAADGSPLTFILPLNIGGSVEINGSILTAYQTTPYLPITVTTSSNCIQEPSSITLNVVLTVPAFVTPKESNYTLSKIAACPLYTLNQIPLNPCLTVAPTFTPPVLETPSPLNPYPYVTTPPSALHQYRSVPRIRSINQIATVVRGQSASEATIRKQTATLQGNKAPTTTFFRKPVPLPPCIPRFVRPPPYPPAPPCRTKPL